MRSRREEEAEKKRGERDREQISNVDKNKERGWSRAGHLGCPRKFRIKRGMQEEGKKG